MKQKNVETIIVIFETVASIAGAIALLNFITAAEFKLYFTGFLIASLCFLVANELKLIFNKKESKKITILGIVLMVVTIGVSLYSLYRTMVI